MVYVVFKKKNRSDLGSASNNQIFEMRHRLAPNFASSFS